MPFIDNDMGVSPFAVILLQFAMGIERQVVPVVLATGFFSEFYVFLINCKNPFTILALDIGSGSPDALRVVIRGKVCEPELLNKGYLVGKELFGSSKGRFMWIQLF